jgi:hypothetical protein
VKEILGSVRDVPLSEARRHEPLDRRSTELFRRPAEHISNHRVGVRDSTMRIDGDNNVWASVEYRLGAKPE